MTNETMQAVTEELIRRRLPATFEYPGFICLTTPSGQCMNWGGANETIGCDLTQHDGTRTDGGDWFESSIPGDSAEVQRIADHIACSYSEWLGGLSR